jgi:nicotinamidase-related amidase
MPTTALLVIDVQESFPNRPYWRGEQAPAFLTALNRLISGATARGVPIVRVFHVDGDGAFSKASGLVRPLTGLRPFDAAFEVEKHRHSALVGTGLETWLIQHGIRRLIVSGIRTEQCCETTTRHASDLGFEVDFVTEATLTFPMTHAGSGQTLSADELRLRTELVLADRFATICTVDSALGRVV